uniref:Uncharacterized protein n=1 Tax=Rhizophora mucronata TaxID=61149 RepID=A0A2P2QR71_RHIMU
MCTSLSPLDRPSMRDVVSMLIESNEEGRDFIPSPTLNFLLKDEA